MLRFVYYFKGLFGHFSNLCDYALGSPVPAHALSSSFASLNIINNFIPCESILISEITRVVSGFSFLFL